MTVVLLKVRPPPTSSAEQPQYCRCLRPLLKVWRELAPRRAGHEVGNPVLARPDGLVRGWGSWVGNVGLGGWSSGGERCRVVGRTWGKRRQAGPGPGGGAWPRAGTPAAPQGVVL